MHKNGEGKPALNRDICMERELIRKYINKACAAQEAEEVRNWLADPASDITIFHEVMDEMWREHQPVNELTPEDDKRLWENIQLKRSERHKVVVNKGRRSKVAWMSISVAASIAVLLYASTLIFQGSGSTGKMLSAAWDTIKNESGVTRRIEMPDKTVVVLQAGSSILYDRQFNKSNRQVKLTGEAFFEVSRNASSPFEVITGDLTTRVLGTSFNIEAYPFEPDIHVSLATGKVAVLLNDGLKNTGTEYLAPGQMLSFDKAARSNSIKPVTLKDYGHWLKGYLVFNDVPLKQVLDRISFRYHINIDYSALAGKMDDKRVTSVFRTETAYEILSNLLFLYGYHYKITEKGVVIFPD